jgi:hypothetical protein
MGMHRCHRDLLGVVHHIELLRPPCTIVQLTRPNDISSILNLWSGGLKSLSRGFHEIETP